ncbi:hypothetical protein LRM19_01200 [Enterobacter sp. PI-10]|uniref:hypothetical protein n=1 Tax=Enterobacter sp. PI-10 TaxID=2899140 RepID=UPI00230054FE|nr:hypothetical protein [Enterobacter sp. PI-10]MDA5602989.1 hypothetical protein [Enterobacter sp. PI-10]
MKTEYRGFEINIDIQDSALEWIASAKVSKVTEGFVEDTYFDINQHFSRTAGGLNAGLHMLEVAKERINKLLDEKK